MIRLATGQDASAIRRIEVACFGPDAWSEALVDLELVAPGRVVVVADRDGVLDGYASVAVVADVADLTRIGVRPAQQRAGLARALLTDVIARAAGEGAARMMLEVAATNEAAIGLYVATGFVEIARRRDYYGRGDDAIVMERAPLAP